MTVSFAGDAYVSPATVYVPVHVFGAEEAPDPTKPFQVFIEGVPYVFTDGKFTLSADEVVGSFEVDIPAYLASIAPLGLVSIYRFGVKEFTGVLTRIERTLSDAPTVKLMGVDVSWLLNTRVVDSAIFIQQTPQVILQNLLTNYPCGITPGNLGTYTPTVSNPFVTPILVQSLTGVTYAGGNPPQITATMNQQPSNGNTLLAAIGVWTSGIVNTVTSIVQSGVVWQKVVEIDNGSGGDRSVQIWHGYVGSDASASLTVNISGGVNNPSGTLELFEFNGLLQAQVDQTASNNGAGGSPDTGTTIPTAQTEEVLFGAIIDESTTAQSNPTNGFTLYDGAALLDSGNISLSALIKIVSTIQTADCQVSSGSGTEGWMGCMASFKAAMSAISSGLTLSFDTAQLLAAVKQVIAGSGWVYRVNPNFTFDYSNSFGVNAAVVFSEATVGNASMIASSSLLTEDISLISNSMHVKGKGISSLAQEAASILATGLLEGTDIRSTISDQTTLNAIAQFDALQNSNAGTMIQLMVLDLYPAGTYHVYDYVTVNSPTLGLSGLYQVKQFTRSSLTNPYVTELQLGARVPEVWQLDESVKRLLNELAT